MSAAVGYGAVIATAAYDFRDVSVHNQDWVKCDPGLFDMALKNLGFLKSLKSPNLGFLGLKKIKT